MDAIPLQIEKKDLIDGLGKGLRVIEAFDDDHPHLTASEVAVRAGITRTATSDAVRCGWSSSNASITRSPLPRPSMRSFFSI